MPNPKLGNASAQRAEDISLQPRMAGTRAGRALWESGAQLLQVERGRQRHSQRGQLTRPRSHSKSMPEREPRTPLTLQERQQLRPLAAKAEPDLVSWEPGGCLTISFWEQIPGSPVRCPFCVTERERDVA